MLKSYFTIAIRNLAKHKLFSFINIFGLALSMCIGLIVIMHLQDDYSFDKFHPRSNNVYRVISDVTNKNGEDYQLASSPLPLAAALQDKYAFVENTVHIYPGWSGKATSITKSLPVKVAFTEPSFFNVFGFKLEQGDGAAALSSPNKIILSKETAIRFFGKGEATGKMLEFENLGTFLVTGVMQKPPTKSHIDFDVYCSMSSVANLEKGGELKAQSGDWSNVFSGYTYVLLKEGTSKKQLLSALSSLSAIYKKTITADKSRISFDVQSLSKITPGIELRNSIGRGSTYGKIAAEISIALIILISACFNYTNLSLARALKRGKEVGIRKVSGALRHHIFLQFIIESVLLSFLSLGLAFVILQLLKNYSGLEIDFFPETVVFDAALAGAILVFGLGAGLLAGVVPALTLSTFKPVEILKNLANIKLFGRNGLRKVLIVIQFSLSLMVIIFMLVFHKQFDYMATGDYGFNRERIINIPLQGSDYHLLKNAVAGISGVERVSATSDNMGKFASGTANIKLPASEVSSPTQYFDVDENFALNMQLKLLAGTGITVPVSGEVKEVMINETAIKALQIKSAGEAVGQTILLNDSIKVKITGVLKDFHFEGFEFPIRPLVLRSREKGFSIVNVKTTLDEANAGRLVAALENTWKTINPNEKFSYTWFDKQFYESKSATDTVSTLGLLAFMGITIASLGLLGMVVYTVEGRVKEISIRKVMGADVSAIVGLLSKSFLKLVAISILIAAPIGWICGFIFLQTFAVRVEVGIGLIALASAAVLTVSLVVIGSQVLQAATVNPANNLRAE